MSLSPVTQILIEEIKQEAYRLRDSEGVKYQKALDRVSKAKGFRSWCDVNERLKAVTSKDLVTLAEWYNKNEDDMSDETKAVVQGLGNQLINQYVAKHHAN